MIRPTFVCLMALVLGVSASQTLAQRQNVRKITDDPNVRLQVAKRRQAIKTPPSAPAPDGTKAVIVCEKPIHNFGETWLGPKLAWTYVIKNAGAQPLTISRVKPSCGCTTVGSFPQSIAPGATGEFSFAIDSRRLRGKYQKSITITSNDPVNPQYRLTLTGVCKRYIDVTPPAANFGKIPLDRSQERVLKVSNNTDKDLVLTVDPAKDGPFSYEIVEVTPGKNYEVHVKMTPPYSGGRLRGKATLSTNIEQQKSITIATNATVPERLDVQPKAVTFNTKNLSANSTIRPIRFTNYGATPVKVIEAVSSDPKIKVRVNERTPGKAYTINLDVPSGYQPPPGGARITLKTDDPSKPELYVPVTTQVVRKPRTPVVPRKRPTEQLIGKPAPTFSLTTTQGKPLSNATLKNSVTVLDFFAVNCGFCAKQIPRMETVRKEYEAKGVRFVAVSQTMRKPYPDSDVKAKIKKLGFKGELAIDSGNTTGPLFKANSFPTMVIVGKTGRVEAANIGNVGDLESRMKTQLDALLAGKPIPAIAGTAPSTRKPAVRRPAANNMIGKPAPAFAIKTVDGKAVGNADFAKHPATVLNFVAPNCGFCKKQVPRTESIRKAYEAKGVRFVNIAQTMRKKYETQEVINVFKGIGSGLELAHDPSNAVGLKYSARGFPTMIVVGKSGKVEAVNVGNLSDLEARLKGQLDALIAGKPIPAAFATKPSAAKAKKPAARKKADSMIGKAAPKFSFKTLDGKTVDNAAVAQSPATILNFVASNCGFCKKQVPRVETFRQSYVDKGVRFINVVQTMRKKYETSEVVKIFSGIGSKFELSHDVDNKMGALFGASGFPTMVVLGKSGKVEAVNVGNMADLESRLKGQLNALISGKPIPAKFATKPSTNTRKRPAEGLVGKPAPKFAATTKGGKPVGNAEFAKSPATVLNFVAPNCGFCKRQIPNVEKVRAKYQAKGVRFVNVAMSMHKEYALEESFSVFKGIGSNLEFVHDPKNAVGGLFKAVSFPTMIVVDRKGKITNVNIGAKPDIEKVLSTQLDRLIAAGS